MFIYQYMYMDKMRNGTANLSPNDVLKDFAVTPTNMSTQMHILSAMYGLNDTVTLMAVLPYVMKEMEHQNRAGSNFQPTPADSGIPS